jgi:hypothetical protein
MKFLLYLTSLVYSLTSCENPKTSESHFHNVSKKDTTCLKELADARKDIDNGSLVYCHYAGNIAFYELRSEKEMTFLLRQFNIDFQNAVSSDLVYEDQTQHCYCGLMTEKIQEKYGNRFLDSLLNQSDSLYVVNNINDTFYYANCDLRPNYPGDTDNAKDEYSEILQYDLENDINYPPGYLKKSNDDLSAFVDIYFLIDKVGNATITGYWFEFDVKANHKYESYFESIISRVLKKTGWASAIIRKQKVNSDMVMRFYFD